ncbi:MAG: AAA family ATPase [Succinivibrio sp.]|nr:AAA family ATPase [Succinivibrio sp.]
MLKEIADSNSNFLSIRKEKLLYIDKTSFIKKFELLKKSVSLFLRPRRFGKTLFTEILYYYYDIAQKGLFDKLFEGTYIHENTTPYKSSYAVVKFDFSGVSTSGSVDDILEDVRIRVIQAIVDFFKRYPDLIPDDIREYATDKSNLQASVAKFYFEKRDYFNSCSRILNHFLLFFQAQSKVDYKLMFIIDEYDNFTNDILSRDKKAFIDIANKQSELGAFYGTIRNFNQYGVIEKVFITGILPITMDTMISGFVSSKISQEPILNELAGFTDSEVLELLHETVDFNQCKYPATYLQEFMKERFNGYKFAKHSKDKVYNSTLCLNFVNTLRTDYDSLPEMGISSNMDVNFDKLVGYLNLLSKQDRDSILKSIIDEVPLRFSIPDSIKLDNVANNLAYTDGLAMLFYLGFLTIISNEEAKLDYGDSYVSAIYLKVPNLYFKILFGKFITDRANISWGGIVNQSNNVVLMEKQNNLEGLIEAFKLHVQQALVKADITHESEALFVVSFFLMISMNTKAFHLQREYSIKQNDVVVSDCAYELSKSKVGKHKRADLVAINKEGGPSYLFEFKYQRNENSSLDTKEKVRAKLLNDAKEQIKFYQTDDKLKTIKDLHKYVIMYTYDELTVQEV